MSDSGLAMLPDSLVGHTVGRFEIDGYVGEEQLGRVYSAIEKPGGRRVTLKVLNPTLVNNYEGAGRFQREMLASAHVAEHPNAVAMLDFGDHRGIFHYLVMEAFDARALAEELIAGPFPPERVARIAWQIANVLSVAHAASIVHRNLTPENVLLLNNADGDYVKIRDFGLARMTNPEAGAGEALTSAGARVGSVTYQAPEYIESEIVDPRGDLYALGILMYEMLCGHPPFRGKKGAVLEAHCTAPVPRPSIEAKGVPGWLDDLVFSLLRKAPAERPESADVVKATIERGLGKPVTLPKIVAVATKSQLSTFGASPSTQAVAAGAAAGALGLAASFVLVVLAVIVLGGIIAMIVFK